ncbi:MAG: hypothetical protein JXA58_03480 [Dehalococcoidia bacterium]|nr:hypothetical protein [Dehalococcoidia bacterium]
MLTASKVLLACAGVLLIVDAVLMATGTTNPLLGLPLPCPMTLAVLGIGIVLFVLGSHAFKKP